MRIRIASLPLLLLTFFSFAQPSETLVPRYATSVFSVNNISLLQRISLDDLVKYEFMEELQQELFDGSTSGKTLKDSGIDFDQKLNIFYGKDGDFELSGVTFGVQDRRKLFDAFDDFQPVESEYEGVDFYASYFNTIAIKGNSAILFRVTPNMELVNSITDSIWYARGNGYPWDWDTEQTMEELLRDLENSEDGDEEVIWDEMEIAPEDDEIMEIAPEHEGIDYPVADSDPASKTYYELIDSVQVALQQEFLVVVCEELFVRNENLINNSPEFKQQLSHTAEGMFYLDNSRNLRKDRNFIELLNQYPGFYGELENLYQGNVMVGDLVIGSNAVELQLNAKYGERLGDVYTGMTEAKFDSDILKYIHKDNTAFVTFRINTREAYERLYDVFHPMLEREADSNRQFSESLLLLEMYDELLNKDAIFKSIPGGAFMTYNGISKVRTRKFVFEYDEETYEYIEREVEAEEDMPLFTFGITTEYPNIAEKILRHLERTESNCRKDGDIWIFEKAIVHAAPLYVFMRNGMILYTNDERLARQHPEGYGSDALGKSLSKQARNSGFIYGYADLGKAIEGLPREIFSDNENELIDVMRGKPGRIELTSSGTQSTHTDFNLKYSFEGEYDASGTYILDLINSLYVISK